jgi:hypothetical protein
MNSLEIVVLLCIAAGAVGNLVWAACKELGPKRRKR